MHKKILTRNIVSLDGKAVARANSVIITSIGDASVSNCEPHAAINQEMVQGTNPDSRADSLNQTIKAEVFENGIHRSSRSSSRASANG